MAIGAPSQAQATAITTTARPKSGGASRHGMTECSGTDIAQLSRAKDQPGTWIHHHEAWRWTTLRLGAKFYPVVDGGYAVLRSQSDCTEYSYQNEQKPRDYAFS